jgi:predicted SAM-dependent methyltransferase
MNLGNKSSKPYLTIHRFNVFKVKELKMMRNEKNEWHQNFKVFGLQEELLEIRIFLNEDGIIESATCFNSSHFDNELCGYLIKQIIKHKLK